MRGLLSPAAVLRVLLCIVFVTGSYAAWSHDTPAHGKEGNKRTKTPVSNEVSGDGLVAKNFWVRLVPPVSSVTAAFGTLESDENDSLVSATSSRAEIVELHTNEMEDGVMKMRTVDAIPVPKTQGVRLQPGGLHIMLINLVRPVKQGETIDITLVFKSGKVLRLEAPVVERASRRMHK